MSQNHFELAVNLVVNFILNKYQKQGFLFEIILPFVHEIFKDKQI